MTRARRELVDIETTPYYHCICRCVRRAFLCGEDNFTGKSYEHRKTWVLERLRFLQSIFSIDLCAYAIMSNHYHLVVRLNAQAANDWSEEEVMVRWGRLFSLPVLVANYQAGQTTCKAEQHKAQAIIATWRERLSDLSWFMRSLNEDLARRANAEDGCKGRFWEGRFKSQALLDEAAVLTCMSYVDLNPVRAAKADTPENSDFTSIQQRINEYSKESSELALEKPRLTSLASPNQDSHKNAFSFEFHDYLELLEWSGRAIRGDKRSAISAAQPPILKRLRLDPYHYLQHVQKGGRSRHVAALGSVDRLREAAERLGRRFLKGHCQSKRLYLMNTV
jgi:REP element-mobilizing transposase RayT